MNTSSFGSVLPQQRRTRALGNRLFDPIFLVGWNRIRLHYGIVLVVQVEHIWRESQAHRITLAPVTVHDYSHDTLLKPGHLPPSGAHQYLTPTIRPR